VTGRMAAPGFPAEEVRARAREGISRVFPPTEQYGTTAFGADPGHGSGTDPGGGTGGDPLDALWLAPPVFMPRRLDKLIELGREPLFGDVAVETVIGGFRSPLPLFLSALGSTQLADAGLGIAIARQAGRLGLPLVIGENVVPVRGHRQTAADAGSSLAARIREYSTQLPEGVGGVAVQQSTQDADAEVWNLVYSDPVASDLLASGRLAFELKVGQGAKPGLGGMTVVSGSAATALAERFALHRLSGIGDGLLRSASPGTFTKEILRRQVQLMRNNYPQARVWVKLFPGRDVGEAARVAWEAGADAVTVDGAEGGTGWAPTAFLQQVGLPLGVCLRQIGPRPGCLLATGRMWEGVRVVKALALGARAAGLGRAALLAADEDPEDGLVRLVQCLTLEIQLLVSAMGKYACREVSAEDLWPHIVPPAHTGAADDTRIDSPMVRNLP
jgi:methylamine---glutamate N-methyltransferase subunit C